MIFLFLGKVAAQYFASPHNFLISHSLISHVLATPLVLNATISSQQVYLDGSFQVTGTKFESCAAVFDMWQTGTGGAIFAQNGFLSMQECIFTRNVATYGGAVMTSETATTIFNTQFTENIAKSDVGALWSLAIEEQTSVPKYPLTLNRVNFTKNKATNYYGAACSNFTHPMIQFCHFQGNEAGLSVGALGLIGFATATVTDTDFQNNVCLAGGELACAALWIQGVQTQNIFSVRFDNTFFKSNSANGEQKDYIVTYGQVQLTFTGYTCFDIVSDRVFSSLKGEAVYDTQTIKYEVDNLEDCKADFPTETFTASDIFTPTKAPTNTKTDPSETHSSSESEPSESSSSSESMTSESESPTPSESQSQSPPPSSQEEESELNVPALAGSLLGLLLLIIIIIVIVCCCCKKGCCPCCGCCKLCCNCFKCCCCCNKRCCRRKKRKHPDTDIRAPMLVIPRDQQHDDSFVIFVNPQCGPQEIHESSDEDLRPDTHHQETL